MKGLSLCFLLMFGFLSGCSRPTGQEPTQDATDMGTPSSTSDVAAAAPAPSTFSASGVVKAVDPTGKTVTIAQDPVPALQWPAMKMTFDVPDADLRPLKQGDHVSFEFALVGMEGTITTITRQ